MQSAAVDSGQHHLLALFVMQINAGFDASEGVGHIIHNLVDELVEIENRSNFLSRFLQRSAVLRLARLAAGATQMSLPAALDLGNSHG